MKRKYLIKLAPQFNPILNDFIVCCFQIKSTFLLFKIIFLRSTRVLSFNSIVVETRMSVQQRVTSIFVERDDAVSGEAQREKMKKKTESLGSKRDRKCE